MRGAADARLRRELEERVAALAARQHGSVTRAQLVAAGLSQWAVGRRLRAGRLRQLHRGVYRVGPLEAPFAAEMAAVLACGPNAVLSHLSALAIWLPESDRASPRRHPPVEITTTNERGRRRPGIRVHQVARLDRDERTTQLGIPITTPARTLIDVAGAVGSGQIEAAVARAEREGLVARDELLRRLDRHRRRPGSGVLRAILEAHRDAALTRSAAEEAFLALVRKARLPHPETNVRIGAFEVDFLWRARGIAVEVDGFRYHSSRARFEGDRRRDAWLLAHGITVVRLSWRQVTEDALATAVQIGLALQRAGGPAAEDYGRR